MDIAIRVAQESYCERKKVGSILVHDDFNIIAYGYNGTSAGDDNCCEETVDGLLVTKNTVIHAEDNVFRKLIDPTLAKDCTLYITLCPCTFCADKIINHQITRVVYLEDYRSTDGIDKLIDAGIQVELFT